MKLGWTTSLIAASWSLPTGHGLGILSLPEESFARVVGYVTGKVATQDSYSCPAAQVMPSFQERHGLASPVLLTPVWSWEDHTTQSCVDVRHMQKHIANLAGTAVRERIFALREHSKMEW